MSDRRSLAGLPRPVVDQMDAVDLMRASEAVSGFFGRWPGNRELIAAEVAAG